MSGEGPRPHLRGHPLEGDAGGIDRPARRLDHLGPDAVAGDERDPDGNHDGGQGTGPTILGA